MDSKQFKGQKYKVGQTNVAKIVKQDFLAKGFNVRTYENNLATTSGLVKILEIISEKPNSERFVMRWDKNQQTADIDIYKGKNFRKDLWSQDGFKGHHPQIKQERNKERVFKLDIATPKGPIFKGLIKVAVHHKLRLEDSIGLHDG
ncbi:MAG: hypothetical protein ABIJ33_00930 [Patescibacteria group bacterium]|nr:hypothetical protein [Patescibacteria group bacterium]